MRVLLAAAAAALIFELIAIIITFMMKDPLQSVEISEGYVRIRTRKTLLPVLIRGRLTVSKPDTGESCQLRLRFTADGDVHEVKLCGAALGMLRAELTEVLTRVPGSWFGKHRGSISCSRLVLPDRRSEELAPRDDNDIDPVGAPEGVREFRHGDRLRDVHQKLSAKCGKYMVRERYGSSRAAQPAADDPRPQFPGEVSLEPVQLTRSRGLADHLRVLAAFLLLLAALHTCIGTVPRYCYMAAAVLLLRAGGELSKRHGKVFTALFILVIAAFGAAGLTSLTSQLGRVGDLISGAAFRRFDRLFPLADSGKADVPAACFLTAAAAWGYAALAGSEHRAVRLIASLLCIIPTAIFCGSGVTLVLGLAAAVLTVGSGRGVALPLLCAGLAGAVFAMGATVRAADRLSLYVGDMLYGGDIAEPQGRISERAQPEGDTAALEVIMESPEAMYLHGFTGCTYSDGSWQAPRAGELELTQAELNSLNSAGYTADAQPLLLLKNAPTQTLTIRTVGAAKRYAYLPDGARYETDSPAGLENPARGEVAEVTAVKDIFRHTDSLTDAVNNADSVYLGRAAALDRLYRECYTGLSDKTERVLKARLGKAEELSLLEAVNKVRKLLDGCEYDRAAAPQSAERFIQITRKGNSCAFASAAVLALRYCGIPARYAEGYALTSDMAAASDGAVTLTAGDMHAWAEYYVEGAGWLPLETVPEYIGRMPQPRGLTAADGSGSYGSAAVGAEPEQGSRLYERLPDEAKEKSGRSYAPMIVAAGLLGILFVLSAFAFRLSRDPVYALSKCSARLHLSPDSAGRYDFSGVGDDAQRKRLDRLQEVCIVGCYSRRKPEPGGGARAYLGCIFTGGRSA